MNSESDWSPPVSAILPPIPDVLPQVQTSEDWQAAFGFSNNSNNSRNNTYNQSTDVNRSMVSLLLLLKFHILFFNLSFIQH